MWTKQPALDSPCGTPDVGAPNPFVGYTYCRDSMLLLSMQRGPAEAAVPEAEAVVPEAEPAVPEELVAVPEEAANACAAEGGT
jgi:hypothetical protein